MLKNSILQDVLPVTMLPYDKRKCRWMAYSAILQCLIIYVGAFTILQCYWSPDKSYIDYNKLIRIMYLYDYQACGYKLKTAAALSDIRLSNGTYGLDILPIKWKQAILTVQTRLATKTRTYIETSIAVHVIWMTIAIVMYFVNRKHVIINIKLLKIILFLFFYISVGVVTFDISMAFVHITHIQQSTTQGTVLRYSGWSVELKLENYEESAIPIPIIASILWMRGVIFLACNIFCCNQICILRKKIKKREVKNKLMNGVYFPIPDQRHEEINDKNILYYRRGEYEPSFRDDNLSRGYYD